MGGAIGRGGGGGTGGGGTGGVTGFGGVGVGVGGGGFGAGAGATMESLIGEAMSDGASLCVIAGSNSPTAPNSSNRLTPIAMAKRRPSAGGLSHKSVALIYIRRLNQKNL